MCLMCFQFFWFKDFYHKVSQRKHEVTQRRKLETCYSNEFGLPINELNLQKGEESFHFSVTVNSFTIEQFNSSIVNGLVINKTFLCLKNLEVFRQPVVFYVSIVVQFFVSLSLCV